MARTLADLKSRIVRETNRDELTDATAVDATQAYAQTVSDAITGAIDDFADMRFAFNEGVYTSALTAGSNSTPIPTIPTFMRKIDRLSMNYGGAGTSRYTLRVVELDEWDRVAGYVTSVGQPTIYTVLGTNVRVWPTPNFAYPLTWVGIVDQPALANDMASNAWTDDAQDLIAAQARVRLLRDYFRDPDGARLAQAAVDAALNKLLGRAAERLGTGRLRASW